MSMRAQPVGSVFQRMPRLVRELSMKTGKKIRLEMTGESTEVDRTIGIARDSVKAVLGV